MDELNYQFLRRLEKEGLITLKQLYIDGTKIEANANCYTFVWRGTLNYHLAGLLDTVDALYQRYNTLLSEYQYGARYDLGNAQMFIIEGMDKVRKVIEKNRKRKLTKHKKISNHTAIEIDSCSPLEILKLQIRSIQTEGHFGDIKENEKFRRFNYRSTEKVYKEFMLYAISRNINKYHRFLHDKIHKFEGKTGEKAA